MTTGNRRVALGLAAIAAIAVAAWALIPSNPVVPSTMPLPGHSVSWRLNSGYGTPAFAPSTAMTTTVVPIEVDYPTCIANGYGHWFDVTVSYAPASVTIQVLMTPAAANGCPSQKYPRVLGPLPEVGGYASGIYYAVHLREPLGGRAIFDGGTLPPAPRPYR
jgi:hypothetical protein